VEGSACAGVAAAAACDGCAPAFVGGVNRSLDEDLAWVAKTSAIEQSKVVVCEESSCKAQTYVLPVDVDRLADDVL
jgi:hypothetical protein